MNIPRKAVAFLTSAVSALTVLSVAAASTGGSRSCATADVRTVKIEDGELWWGAANFFGTNMPFSAKTRLTIRLKSKNYSNQCASLLMSNHGRVIWSNGQSDITFKDGAITMDADAPVVVETAAEPTLPGAYRHAMRTWFPPSGKTPDLLFFTAPQLNTWIELTYHQNQKEHPRVRPVHARPRRAARGLHDRRHVAGRLRRLALRAVALPRPQGDGGQTPRDGLQGDALDVPLRGHGYAGVPPHRVGTEPRRRAGISDEGRVPHGTDGGQARRGRIQFQGEAQGVRLVERLLGVPRLLAPERQRLVHGGARRPRARLWRGRLQVRRRRPRRLSAHRPPRARPQGDVRLPQQRLLRVRTEVPVLRSAQPVADAAAARGRAPPRQDARVDRARPDRGRHDRGGSPAGSPSSPARRSTPSCSSARRRSTRSAR